MILQDGYFDKHCEKCDKQYTNVNFKWCRLCQSSGNKQIDDFIQEKQSKINYGDTVFEWIPYDQFDNIKETGQRDFTRICLAIWKDGPLDYDYKKKKEYVRLSDEYVGLKYLCNSENITDELLNEV